MEPTLLEDAAVLLRECLKQLSVVEACFVESCYLADPKMSLKAFGEEHGLKPKDMADLRLRVMSRLREELIKAGVHCVADVL